MTEIIDEIADVKIMLEQMILLYDIADEVDIRTQYKIDRLDKRLNGTKEKK